MERGVARGLSRRQAVHAVRQYADPHRVTVDGERGPRRVRRVRSVALGRHQPRVQEEALHGANLADFGERGDRAHSLDGNPRPHCSVRRVGRDDFAAEVTDRPEQLLGDHRLDVDTHHPVAADARPGRDIREGTQTPDHRLSPALAVSHQEARRELPLARGPGRLVGEDGLDLTDGLLTRLLGGKRSVGGESCQQHRRERERAARDESSAHHSTPSRAAVHRVPPLPPECRPGSRFDEGERRDRLPTEAWHRESDAGNGSYSK
jgi:hypothetical protein